MYGSMKNGNLEAGTTGIPAVVGKHHHTRVIQEGQVIGKKAGVVISGFREPGAGIKC
jgi:hypothetical protein